MTTKRGEREKNPIFEAQLKTHCSLVKAGMHFHAGKWGMRITFPSGHGCFYPTTICLYKS